MKIFCLFIFLTVVCAASSQKNIQVLSPNGAISFSFHISNGNAFYNVSFKNKPLVKNSAISLDFLETGEFKTNLATTKPVIRNGEEDYELITGKSKLVRQAYRE